MWLVYMLLGSESTGRLSGLNYIFEERAAEAGVEALGVLNEGKGPQAQWRLFILFHAQHSHHMREAELL
jgi:hypothetical protein